jgi:hypothetical protein
MERVRLLSGDEIYLVTRVDHEARVADVLPVVYGKGEILDVPFHAIEAIPGCRPPKTRPD